MGGLRGRPVTVSFFLLPPLLLFLIVFLRYAQAGPAGRLHSNNGDTHSNKPSNTSSIADNSNSSSSSSSSNRDTVYFEDESPVAMKSEGRLLRQWAVSPTESWPSPYPQPSTRSHLSTLLISTLTYPHTSTRLYPSRKPYQSINPRISSMSVQYSRLAPSSPLPSVGSDLTPVSLTTIPPSHHHPILLPTTHSFVPTTAFPLQHDQGSVTQESSRTAGDWQVKEPQYTLQLLPQPISAYDQFQKVSKPSKPPEPLEEIPVRLFPWTPLGYEPRCLDHNVLLKVIHQALEDHPPPDRYAVKILPPSSDLKCAEKMHLDHLLREMTSSVSRVLIGSMEPSLCRVARHLAEKHEKILISWSCLDLDDEFPSRTEEQTAREQLLAQTANLETLDPAHIFARKKESDYESKRDFTSREVKFPGSLRKDFKSKPATLKPPVFRMDESGSSDRFPLPAGLEALELARRTVRAVMEDEIEETFAQMSKGKQDRKSLDQNQKQQQQQSRLKIQGDMQKTHTEKSGKEKSTEIPDLSEQLDHTSAGRTTHHALVTPTSQQIALATRAALQHLGWRHVLIITLDTPYWRQLAHWVDVELRSWRHVVPALAALNPTLAPSTPSLLQLFNLRSTPVVKAYVLVMPLSSTVTTEILKVAYNAQVTKKAALLVVDPLTPPAPTALMSVGVNEEALQALMVISPLSTAQTPEPTVKPLTGTSPSISNNNSTNNISDTTGGTETQNDKREVEKKRDKKNNARRKWNEEQDMRDEERKRILVEKEATMKEGDERRTPEENRNFPSFASNPPTSLSPSHLPYSPPYPSTFPTSPPPSSSIFYPSSSISSSPSSTSSMSSPSYASSSSYSAPIFSSFPSYASAWEQEEVKRTLRDSVKRKGDEVLVQLVYDSLSLVSTILHEYIKKSQQSVKQRRHLFVTSFRTISSPPLRVSPTHKIEDASTVNKPSWKSQDEKSKQRPGRRAERDVVGQRKLNRIRLLKEKRERESDNIPPKDKQHMQDFKTQNEYQMRERHQEKGTEKNANGYRIERKANLESNNIHGGAQHLGLVGGANRERVSPSSATNFSNQSKEGYADQISNDENFDTVPGAELLARSVLNTRMSPSKSMPKIDSVSSVPAASDSNDEIALSSESKTTISIKSSELSNLEHESNNKARSKREIQRDYVKRRRALKNRERKDSVFKKKFPKVITNTATFGNQSSVKPFSSSDYTSAKQSKPTVSTKITDDIRGDYTLNKSKSFSANPSPLSLYNNNPLFNSSSTGMYNTISTDPAHTLTSIISKTSQEIEVITQAFSDANTETSTKVTEPLSVSYTQDLTRTNAFLLPVSHVQKIDNRLKTKNRNEEAIVTLGRLVSIKEDHKRLDKTVATYGTVTGVKGSPTSNVKAHQSAGLMNCALDSTEGAHICQHTQRFIKGAYDTERNSEYERNYFASKKVKTRSEDVINAIGKSIRLRNTGATDIFNSLHRVTGSTVGSGNDVNVYFYDVHTGKNDVMNNTDDKPRIQETTDAVESRLGRNYKEIPLSPLYIRLALNVTGCGESSSHKQVEVKRKEGEVKENGERKPLRKTSGKYFVMREAWAKIRRGLSCNSKKMLLRLVREDKESKTRGRRDNKRFWREAWRNIKRDGKEKRQNDNIRKTEASKMMSNLSNGEHGDIATLKYVGDKNERRNMSEVRNDSFQGIKVAGYRVEGVGLGEDERNVKEELSQDKTTWKLIPTVTRKKRKQIESDGMVSGESKDIRLISKRNPKVLLRRKNLNRWEGNSEKPHWTITSRSRSSGLFNSVLMTSSTHDQREKCSSLKHSNSRTQRTVNPLAPELQTGMAHKTWTEKNRKRVVDPQISSTSRAAKTKTTAQGASLSARETMPGKRIMALHVEGPTSFKAFLGPGYIDVTGRRAFDFVLLDWKPQTQSLQVVLRFQLGAEKKNHQKIFSGEEESSKENPFDELVFDEVTVKEVGDIDWVGGQVIARDRECELLGTYCGYMLAGMPLAPGYVVLIVLCAIGLLVASIALAIFIRNWLQQKEMSKGPYKILLTSADLTLTNRPDSSGMKSSGGSAGRGRNGEGGLTGRGGGRGRSGVSGRAGGMGALGAGVIGAAIASGGTGSSTPSTAAGEGSLSSVRNTAAELLLKTTHSRASSVRDLDESKAKFNASGDLVHVRYFYHSGHFEVKNKTMNLLKQMHNLRHENVNSFFGLLCDPSRPALVFDYCSRGSLQDVIKQEDIKLDWSFRLSLLTDLVRGMRYLHSSPIRHHGNLTSRNCVIDARWVLRVTDYGMPALSEAQNLPPPCFCSRDLLWKSPEQLRDDGLLSRGTQTSDVFSFSIIMQEVVVRGEPYCMVQLTAQEIIARLKKPPPMIRPSVSKGAAPPDAINIMKQCWAEQPEMRPDFTQIYDLFKKLNQGRRLNIVDTMFQMLEKYSSNLEELIRERTDQLDLEKKKTEQLLNRMLPSSVADQLKLGMPVEPEEFSEVTIYFSDIVGFTTISAYSTPFEVVDLLNDLYTAFDATINHYNVYKVETIGDAYMVVGGVPVRIEDHASQVATMALDLLHLSGKFRIRHLPTISLMLRIGIHTGPCCAGVVGVTMPRYCLFGDTVNTASRMESTGSAWRIHVSNQTADKLREGGYQLQFRGLTQVKGKGELPTYWLLGKDGFDKELPVPPQLGNNHGLDEELVRQGRQLYMKNRAWSLQMEGPSSPLSSSSSSSALSSSTYGPTVSSRTLQQPDLMATASPSITTVSSVANSIVEKNSLTKTSSSVLDAIDKIDIAKRNISNFSPLSRRDRRSLRSNSNAMDIQSNNSNSRDEMDDVLSIDDKACRSNPVRRTTGLENDSKSLESLVEGFVNVKGSIESQNSDSMEYETRGFSAIQSGKTKMKSMSLSDVKELRFVNDTASLVEAIPKETKHIVLNSKSQGKVSVIRVREAKSADIFYKNNVSNNSSISKSNKSTSPSIEICNQKAVPNNHPECPHRSTSLSKKGVCESKSTLRGRREGVLIDENVAFRRNRNKLVKGNESGREGEKNYCVKSILPTEQLENYVRALMTNSEGNVGVKLSSSSLNERLQRHQSSETASPLDESSEDTQSSSRYEEALMFPDANSISSSDNKNVSRNKQYIEHQEPAYKTKNTIKKLGDKHEETDASEYYSSSDDMTYNSASESSSLFRFREFIYKKQTRPLPPKGVRGPKLSFTSSNYDGGGVTGNGDGGGGGEGSGNLSHSSPSPSLLCHNKVSPKPHTAGDGERVMSFAVTDDFYNPISSRCATSPATSVSPTTQWSHTPAGSSNISEGSSAQRSPLTPLDHSCFQDLPSRNESTLL